MPNIFNLILIFFLTAIISWLATFFVRKFAFAWKVLDYPDQARKIHTQPIPLLGGWAIYLSVSLMTSWLVLGGRVNDAKVSQTWVMSFLLAGLLLMIGGYLDDRFRLRWYQSLAFPIVAALIVMAGGLQIHFITNPFGGLLYFDQWHWSGVLQTRYLVPLADILVFFWLLAMMYTTKLLDGLDGLASSISLIASVVIFGVSLFWDAPGSLTSYVSIILAGAIAGFLIWNWYPAKIFLGESGSTFLGFSLGVLAILTGGKIATALLVMGLPMLDVLWAIIRRLRGQRSIAVADTGHLHFRLLRRGLSQRQVVVLMSCVALLFGLVSFFTTTKGKLLALATLVVLMVIGVSLFLKKNNEA